MHTEQISQPWLVLMHALNIAISIWGVSALTSVTYILHEGS
jgi:hypothetical protein